MDFLGGGGNGVAGWGVLDGGDEKIGDLNGAWREAELQRR